MGDLAAQVPVLAVRGREQGVGGVVEDVLVDESGDRDLGELAGAHRVGAVGGADRVGDDVDRAHRGSPAERKTVRAMFSRSKSLSVSGWPPLLSPWVSRQPSA